MHYAFGKSAIAPAFKKGSANVIGIDSFESEELRFEFLFLRHESEVILCEATCRIHIS